MVSYARQDNPPGSANKSVNQFATFAIAQAMVIMSVYKFTYMCVCVCTYILNGTRALAVTNMYMHAYCMVIGCKPGA